MGNFTKSITETFDFDGDSITVTMDRLSRKDYFHLSPNEVIKDVDGNQVPTDKEALRMISEGIELLPTYVTSISGLHIGDKHIVDINEIINESYFTKLFSDMFTALMKASTVGKDEEKK